VYQPPAWHLPAAAHGIQLPLVEHDLLATWLLAEVGHDPSAGITTIGWADADATSVVVPWAAVADQILVVSVEPSGAYRVRIVAAADVTIEPRSNLAGQPRDLVTGLQPGNGIGLEPTTGMSLRHRAALIRAVQMCGAMDAAVTATVRHTTERVQFGRALSQFQTVQHRLAEAGAEAALARAATRAALVEAVATDFVGAGVEIAIAAARSCAGHAGSVVVRAAHQLHGAIGTTREHHLHRVTVPILAWTNEYGTVPAFDDLLTRAAIGAETAAADGPAAGVWSLVSDPSPASGPRGH
jgi:acyl-CoA dehydrogenase